MSEFTNRRVSGTAFGEMDVHYLLGRRQVQVDDVAISGCVQGKVVLIAGAGGMIGSEQVRQVVAYDPAQVILIERSEPVRCSCRQQPSTRQYDNLHRGALGSNLEPVIYPCFRPRSKKHLSQSTRPRVHLLHPIGQRGGQAHSSAHGPGPGW